MQKLKVVIVGKDISVKNLTFMKHLELVTTLPVLECMVKSALTLFFYWALMSIFVELFQNFPFVPLYWRHFGYFSNPR